MNKPLHWRLPGLDLHGEARGSNPSAIFLHGFGGCMLDWDSLWTHLDPALAAIRYDLRDFGQSSAHDARPFSHSDDLLALIDAQGIARADLIGISMGGAVAANFALDHPDRVRRLTLISPLLLAWDWSQNWRDLWQAITDRARSDDMEGARRLWAAHPLFATAHTKPEAAAALIEGIARYSGAQWIADHQRPSLPDIDRLPMLSCPTLLLSGEHDLPDFRLIADLVEGCARDVRRIDFQGCGHMLTLEAPKACAKAIGGFLLDNEIANDSAIPTVD
ncbi:MAG TPA: alpha/beta hydrolase [Sphingobium sp.]|uniref:alpha/beta fold hydrolase n=1 Tax=Sphingobium sp. TaxID=1912891 RepID=UPI002ED2AC92